MKTTVQFTESECRRRWVGARANLRSGLETPDYWRKVMREVAAARMSIAALSNKSRGKQFGAAHGSETSNYIGAPIAEFLRGGRSS